MKGSLVIILVNYNGFSDTKACLESIKKSQGELPFVVVVDNASKDADSLNNLSNCYPHLHIIKSPENLGFGRANNVGIKWAQKSLDFEYLLLLNNDTIVEPDCFYYLKEAFRKNTDIGITTGKTMYEGNREVVWYGGGEINYKRGWPKISDYNQNPQENGANNARFVSFVSGCVMMFSRKSIMKLKGFDDEFFMYCEDLELSMRAKRLGFKLYYEPKSVIYHKVQGSLKEKSESKVTGLRAANSNLEFLFYNMKSNQYLAMKKNLPFLKFQLFKGVFWSEFAFLNLKLIKAGRSDILSISSKTINRILELG